MVLCYAYAAMGAFHLATQASFHLFSVNNTNKDRMTLVSICVAKWKPPYAILCVMALSQEHRLLHWRINISIRKLIGPQVYKKMNQSIFYYAYGYVLMQVCTPRFMDQSIFLYTCYTLYKFVWIC